MVSIASQGTVSQNQIPVYTIHKEMFHYCFSINMIVTMLTNVQFFYYKNTQRKIKITFAIYLVL